MNTARLSTAAQAPWSMTNHPRYPNRLLATHKQLDETSLPRRKGSLHGSICVHFRPQACMAVIVKRCRPANSLLRYYITALIKRLLLGFCNSLNSVHCPLGWYTYLFRIDMHMEEKINKLKSRELTEQCLGSRPFRGTEALALVRHFSAIPPLYTLHAAMALNSEQIMSERGRIAADRAAKAVRGRQSACPTPFLHGHRTHAARSREPGRRSGPLYNSRFRRPPRHGAGRVTSERPANTAP